MRREVDGYDLGLACRQSLAPQLERDADELFDLTGRGLAFFGERFAMPFPQRRYDQVFLPDMGGAMENWGCVAWSDAFLTRGEPSHGERELRAVVLLHEMAHMWFGDLVTMRWWDDLWLNEAFAEWACHWAAEAATEHTDVWASFLANGKLRGYAADRAPSTHPVRQPAPDVATAAASFDAITYSKGASVLKQLVAWVGEDAFVEALRRYFARHAYGNATLDDLMAEVAAASGRDTAAWTRGWLETAGTDVLTVEDGVLTATGPDGAEPRPHRLDVGAYVRDGDALALREVLAVETRGRATPLPAAAPADLLLLNDGDLAFAVVRPDAASRDVLLAQAADLPTAVGRTVAVTTAWQLVVLGELPARGLRPAASTRVLRRRARRGPRRALPAARRHRRRVLVARRRRATACSARSPTPASPSRPGPDAASPPCAALARTATTAAQLAALDDLAGDSVDLRWARLRRRAALGLPVADEVAALRADDPDPDSAVSALLVRAASADPQAKQEVWDAVAGLTGVPLGRLRDVQQAFWQPGQAALLAPYAERFLDLLPTLGTGGMISSMATVGALFPVVGADAALLDRLQEAAAAPGLDPVVARSVGVRSDELRRMLAARAGA